MHMHTHARSHAHKLPLATVDTDDNRVISEPELATFLRDRFQNITLAQIADLRPHKPLLGIPFLKGWHDRWAHSTCPDGDAQFSWRRVQACIRGQGTCSIFTCGQMVPTMVYDANSTVSLFERMGRGLRRVFGRRDRTEEAKEEHETSAALSSSSGAQDANLIVPTVDMKSGDTTGIPTSTGNGTAAPIINVGGPSDGSQPTPIAPSPSTGGSSPSTGEPSMDSGTASGGGTDPAQDAALQRRRRQKALIISWDILMLSMNTLALGFALSTITATMSIVSLPFTVISLIVWTISLIIDVQRPVTRRSIGTAPQGA